MADGDLTIAEVLRKPAERRCYICYEIGDGHYYAYRLGSCGAPPRLRLHALQPKAQYAVTQGFGLIAASTECAGAELMREGLRLNGASSFASPGNRADVFCIRSVSRSHAV